MKILVLQICKIVYTNYKKGQRIARRIWLSNHYIPIRKKRMRETTTKSFSPPSENHQKRLLCVFSGTLCHVVAFTIQVWNLFFKVIKAMNFESLNHFNVARFARKVESWWCCWVFRFVLLVLIDRFNSEPFEEDMVFPTLSSRLLHEASFCLSWPFL